MKRAKENRGSAKKERSAHQRKEALLRKNSQKYRQYKKSIFIEKGIIGAVIAGCLLLIFLLFALGKNIVSKFGQEKQLIMEKKRQEALLEEEKQHITLGFTGCMLLHGPILESKWYAENETYDFSEIYKYITPYYSKPDYMVCEFEGTLGGGDYSGYPSFCSPDAIIQNLADSGVDLQLIATNHMYDNLSESFHRTMNVYEEKKIPYTGARQKASDKPYHMVEIKGAKIGFLNYVYESDGDGVELNGASVSEADQALINTFDYEELDSFYKEIEETIVQMKAEGADFLVLNMHWGTEYQLTESVVQRQIAQHLCDLGIDALIGGHPHCEQPIDVLEGKEDHLMYCVYSVGNALSNQRKERISEMPDGHTEDGVIVMLDLFVGEEGQVQLEDMNLIPTWVYMKETQKGNQYYILPVDETDDLEETTGLTGIETEAKASCERTMAVMGSGLAKAKQRLGKQ